MGARVSKCDRCNESSWWYGKEDSLCRNHHNVWIHEIKDEKINELEKKLYNAVECIKIYSDNSKIPHYSLDPAKLARQTLKELGEI